jgi:hypothetical protein
MKPVRSFVAMAGLALVLISSVLHAQEYTFDIAETEKKPYHFGGHLELRPTLSGLDQDAAWYKLRFHDRDEGRSLPEYNAALQLQGGIERGPLKVFVRTHTQYQDSYLDTTFKTTVYEGSLTVRSAPSLTIDAGKRTFKWGKGYAWNPVAFVDRPKNPDEPDLNLEGLVVASADYIKSFGGPLKTLAVTPVLVPVLEQVNDDFGESDHVDIAGKVYLLLYDTDIDFLFLSGGSRTTRYGLDFSRNITTSLEVHGEYARINDFKQRLIAGDGSPGQAVSDVSNWLLGLRYLTARDTTCILEYYRNGTGFTEQQMRDYFAFVHGAYDSYLASGDDALLRKAAAAAEMGYGRPNAGRSYLYLRVSQKEPFDVLYWMPAVTAIVNAEDMSYSISPEITYTGITNLDVRLKGTVLAGNRLSEFGEKQNNFRVELLARYYF